MSVLATGACAASYDVAAYVWPAYHPAPRWAELGIFKAGKGEWQSVWEAVPKWEGHDQPRKPLWGYTNEADPKDVAQKIDAAVAHGINVFIYDWYWYEGRPFLEDALDKGFLGAPNNEKMKFFIMWANHGVGPNWDNTRADKGGQIWAGEVSFDEFRKLVARWIELYFRRPNYYRIQDRPVVMLYELQNFVRGLGGVEKAREAIAYLKRSCQEAGLNGAHVMACDFGLDGQPVKDMGFDSATIYNLVHWASPEEQPDYDAWAKRAAGRFDLAVERLKLPAYFPHASVGWDQNPRYPKSKTMPSVTNSTPAKFEVALRRAKDWADRNVPAGYPKLVTVNSWNEWTEGSYLEPDERFGYGYLEAVKRVFGDSPARFTAPQISCAACSQADLDHAVETLNLCYENAARLAARLGDQDKAEFYRKKAAEISAAVARYCRDSRDGLYRPYLLKERRLAQTDQATMFLAFRLPRSEWDERLMAALKGDGFGWDRTPLCTVSRSDPAFFVHDGDYRGNKSWSGSVWTLTNDAVIRSLRAGGEDGVAAELALKTVAAFRGRCAEFLNPDTGRGNGMLRYAWTASQFIRILFEDLFGLEYTPEKGLVCHPAPGFSGTLRNLRLPDGSVRDITVP